MLFDVRVSTEEGRGVVVVVGDVDLASLPRLVAAVDSLDTADRTLDLRAVDWFDPVCLGVLVAADLRSRRGGGSLEVVASPAVGALLAETGLDTVLSVIS